MSEWSARQYTRFVDERTRPVRDLLALVPEGGVERAADLGCGPGNSTEALLDRFPSAQVVGVDSAPDMIGAARDRLPDHRFELATIEDWAAGPEGTEDLVLSNAALQWVPAHRTLLPRLLGRVRAGGHLALQIPDNLDEPAQAAMLDVAAAGPWAARLAGAAASRTPIDGAERIHALLRPLGTAVTVWRTTYYHPLPEVDGVVDWFRGTGLLPFLAPLDGTEREEFLRRYREAIAPSFEPGKDGTVLLPMPRLFVVARR